ncbi:hypothetical protein WA026_002177 [Henosepilachna vigintioctopunctata]|uniref:Uncharacterized protein n=1 Tax=Henosepilachna vigintioctopunctata TaxID=420089 RepID=A0AAW1TZP1_9CUCU
MSYMDDEFFASVVDFYKNKNWKSILNLNEFSNNVKAIRILWVWPDEDDLKFIHKVILKHGMIGVSSIGCGSGLLEWILQESTRQNFHPRPLFSLLMQCKGIGLASYRCGVRHGLRPRRTRYVPPSISVYVQYKYTTLYMNTT